MTTAAGPSRRVLTLAAWLLALPLAVLLSEITVRVSEPSLDPSNRLYFQTLHPGLPGVGPPGRTLRQIHNAGDYNAKIVFNQDGLRDLKDFRDARAEDWFLVGDSFTFGWGVDAEDRVSDQLDRLIPEHVFNLSVPTGLDGYRQLLDFAKAEGAPVGRVLLFISMDTDIVAAPRTATAAAPTPTPAPAPKAEPAAPKSPAPGQVLLLDIKSRLLANSALYFLVTSLVHDTPALRNIAISLGLIIPNKDGIRDKGLPEAAYNWTALKTAELAAEFDTLVVTIPSRALWYGDQIEAASRNHTHFVDELRGRGLTVIDGRAVFEGAGDPLSFHFTNDPHWTAQGHRLMADAIAAYLNSR